MTTEGPVEENIPRPVESGAAVPDDAMSLVTWTVTPAVAEEGMPVVQENTPVPEEDVALVAETDKAAVAAEGATVVQEGTPLAVEDTPPVVGSDIFVAAKDNTHRKAARSGSKLATVARWIRAFVAYVLLLAVLGAAGICAFALVQGTWQVTPVLSGSMRPGFSVGGAVISQRVPVDSLHVRDVIIFSDPYKPAEQIVHRIVKITKGPGGKLLFNTQGDANSVRDPWTLQIKGDYIYKVRWSVPLLGYVANNYQNHKGYYLLGAGIVLILIAVVTILEARTSRSRRHARRANPAS
ncbi:MAG: signal peptidase I [Acidimicrobiales bacterium]